MNINIIGAGTFGIAFASYLSNNNHHILVYHRNSHSSQTLIRNKEHPYLKGHKISNEIDFNNIERYGFENFNPNYLTILAIPSSAISASISCIIEKSKECKFLLLSKGFDIKTGMLPGELLEKKFNIHPNNIAVLSGPNHAEEIMNCKPTATTISSVNVEFSKELQSTLSSDIFRVYTSENITGVQIGGAIKNVIAIASGLCIGLGLGDNTQAALVSRGMNEILKLSTIYNLDKKTLYGLSGLGDLIATCYSSHSRNRQLGILLGKGKRIEEAKSEIGMVSEGINTCKILNEISNKHNIEMPICNEVYKIMFENLDPKTSLYNLMTRRLKEEN